MPQKVSGPDQRNCADCNKPIGNRPRITLSSGKVVCTDCYVIVKNPAKTARKRKSK